MSDFNIRFPDLETFTKYVNETFDVYPVSWTTGGMTGGNCWGEGSPYPIEPETEPEFTVLDDILLDVFPSLSFMQYRVLVNKPIMVVTDDNESGYYGNYSYGKKKSLDIDVLYAALCEL